MTTNPGQETGHVVVMAKPDGFSRRCDSRDTARIYGSWRDTVRWLQGADPDDLENASVVAAVARKAALRMPRYAHYDVSRWMQEAQDLTVVCPVDPKPSTLITLALDIFANLGFCGTDEYRGWLNRVAVEVLYRDSNGFRTHRDVLVPSLLKGPVEIHYLTGSRVALAHAVKLVIRAALTSNAESFSNLIHLDRITEHERGMIIDSLLPDLGSTINHGEAAASTY